MFLYISYPTFKYTKLQSTGMFTSIQEPSFPLATNYYFNNIGCTHVHSLMVKMQLITDYRLERLRQVHLEGVPPWHTSGAHLEGVPPGAYPQVGMSKTVMMGIGGTKFSVMQFQLLSTRILISIFFRPNLFVCRSKLLTRRIFQ